LTTGPERLKNERTQKNSNKKERKKERQKRSKRERQKCHCLGYQNEMFFALGPFFVSLEEEEEEEEEEETHRTLLTTHS
jgi:DNA polymerase sigma